MTTSLEIPPAINPAVVGHDQQELIEFERQETNATFARIVEDLDLTPEVDNDPANRAVLSLVADCWDQTEGMSRPDAVRQREWLTEITLRGVGDKSRYVREHDLQGYLPESNEQEIAAFGKLFDRYDGSETSINLARSIPDIMREFHFDDKFPEHPRPNKLRYCVMPDEAQADVGQFLHSGNGALVTLPGGEKGIVIDHRSYRAAIEERRPNSRGFLAHEIGHEQLSLLIGNGSQPLGSALNELYAEWSGDDKGVYYDEKHMANLLATTGFNIRKDYLPKIASGEMNTADLIYALKERFGSVNTLRLLAYSPSNYNFSERENPADIVRDCVAFTLENNTVTPVQLRENVYKKYSPEIANIMVTNKDIRPLIPENLYSIILERARADTGFTEAALA